MGDGRTRGWGAFWASLATVAAGAVGACFASVEVDPPPDPTGDDAGAGTGAGAGNGTSSGPASCGAPSTSCGGACVRLDADPGHCGACDRACAPAEVCSNGVCTTACEPGLVGCGGACATLGTDPQHCGACGHACGPDQQCVASACVPLQCREDCPLAPPECVDTTRDVLNCGGCGRACNPGEACLGGRCGTCPSGATVCPLGCADLRSDPLNCGFCERACGAAQSCVDGACRGACLDDTMEDNDRAEDAFPIAWPGSSTSVLHGGSLCGGDEDWFRYDTVSLHLIQPVLQVHFTARGAEPRHCGCGCYSTRCGHAVPAGPHNTVTVEIYNAVTRSLVAASTSETGFVVLGAFGPELKQDLLLRVVAPEVAEYPYTLSVSVHENYGEEGECEC